MTYTVCGKCGKELDSESIIFQKFVSYSASPLGFTQIPEWREVSWQKEMTEQAKTVGLKGDFKKRQLYVHLVQGNFAKRSRGMNDWVASSGLFLLPWRFLDY